MNEHRHFIHSIGSYRHRSHSWDGHCPGMGFTSPGFVPSCCACYSRARHALVDLRGVMKIREDGRLDYPVTCPICKSVKRSVRKPQFQVCKACKEKALNHQEEIKEKKGTNVCQESLFC